MNVKVVKRDKKIEKYDEKKIERVVQVAGLRKDQAKRLSKLVTQWIDQNKLKQVTSLQIRDKVIAEIQNVDKEVAKKFIWYEKYKDKNYGVTY